MEKEELLGQLRNITNCMIISDLRYVGKDVLYSAILSLNVDDYSMKEWHDAIIYLTGNDVDKSIGKAAAKNTYVTIIVIIKNIGVSSNVFIVN